MAKQSDGAKGQPQFSELAAPELATDSNLIADYAALVGNRKVLTKVQRLALAGVGRWDGLEVYDTTDRLPYVYRDSTSAWELPITEAAASIAPGPSLALRAESYLVKASDGRVDGLISISGAAGSIVHATVVGTLPAGYRIPNSVPFTGTASAPGNAQLVQFFVQDTGVVLVWGPPANTTSAAVRIGYKV